MHSRSDRALFPSHYPRDTSFHNDRNVGRAVRDIRSALMANNYSVHSDDNTIGEPRVTAPRASTGDFIAHFSRPENLKVLIGTAYSWFALDVRTWDELLVYIDC